VHLRRQTPEQKCKGVVNGLSFNEVVVVEDENDLAERAAISLIKGVRRASVGGG
jgi:hypothetical protein